MRRPEAIVASLCALLLAVAPLRAGLYLPAEPPQATLGTDPRLFADWLRDSRTLPMPVQGDFPLQRRYREQLAALEALQRTGQLTPIDRVNLSGYYLRLRNPATELGPAYVQKAIRVLEEVPPAQRDFMTLANLATAYQLSGEGRSGRELSAALQRAQAYLEQAIAAWPESSLYYNTRLLTWYLRAEQFHLELLKKRALEALQPDRPPERPSAGRGGGAVVQPDHLFAGIPYVGPKGQYLLGPLPPRAAQRIPTDAYALVAQLVLWLPMDDRLFWLLGELANAEEGNFGLAFEKILDELSYARNYRPADLSEHRKELLQAKLAGDALLNELRVDRLRQFGQHSAEASLLPLTGMLPPGVAPLLAEVGSAVAVDDIVRKPTPAKETASGSAPADMAPEKPAGDWRQTLLDWRPLAIAFLSGAVVATLAGMQIRQILRRRRPAP